jgi:hypothetical protein
MWQGIIRTKTPPHLRAIPSGAGSCDHRQPELANYRKSEALTFKKAKIRQLVLSVLGLRN